MGVVNNRIDIDNLPKGGGGGGGNIHEYSTEEKIVGKWIDGKPIYEKTFTGLNHSTTSSYAPIQGVEIENAEKLINYTAYQKAITQDSSANVTGFLFMRIRNGKVEAYSGSGLSAFETFVLQYTKTTD